MSTETLPANDASKATNDVYFRCFKGCEGRHSVFDVIYTLSLIHI